ncbi:MAG: glycosyltransferase [Candidatus Nanoarchaeia archaeon]
MKYTIGVPAYKEISITKCLQSLLAEQLPSSEIIVVCPDDETALLVKSFKGVKLIKEKSKQGKPAAVNKILKAAKGDVIILTDADMFINNGSLRKLVSHFKDKSVGVVCGHPVVIPQKGMLGYWGSVLYDLAHQSRLAGANHLSTNLCAFRRGLVKSIPLESLVDDYVIGLEASKKHSFIYEPRAIVNVRFPSTTRDFLKQRVRTFAGYMQVKDWYGSSERSFGSEARAANSVLSYVKSPKNLFWVVCLAFYRLRAWLGAYWVYRVKKKSLKDVWVPALSTKK